MAGSQSGSAVLMSIHKSGTNLVGRLIASLGYRMIGPGFEPSYRHLDASWAASGRPAGSWAPSPDGLATFILASYPTGTCACVHRLSARSRRTAGLMKRRVPIVFNYRDPRDVLISEIYYTMSSPPPFASRQRESRLFRSMATMEDRIDRVLDADEYFDVTFRQHEWLLRRPEILAVSYEELVGPHGGGTAALQLKATRRVMQHLAAAGTSPAGVAATLYNRRVRTFRQGRIGSWRQEFTPRLQRKFIALHRDILEMYGYPER